MKLKYPVDRLSLTTFGATLFANRIYHFFLSVNVATMMAMRKFFRVCLLVLSLGHLTSGSTEFSISDAGVSCTGDFEVTSLQMDCGDYCTFGSFVKVQGLVTVTDDLSTTTPVVKVKLANMVEIFNDEVDICKSLEPQDGYTTCPSAGSYTIQPFSFEIPGDGDQWYAQNGYWYVTFETIQCFSALSSLLSYPSFLKCQYRGASLSLKAYFNFGDSKTVCTTSIKLSKNNGYRMVAGGMMMFGLAGFMTSSYRRRHVASIQIGEDEGTQSHFEMMNGDAGVRV